MPSKVFDENDVVRDNKGRFDFKPSRIPASPHSPIGYDNTTSSLFYALKQAVIDSIPEDLYNRKYMSEASALKGEVVVKLFHAIERPDDDAGEVYASVNAFVKAWAGGMDDPAYNGTWADIQRIASEVFGVPLNKRISMLVNNFGALQEDEEENELISRTLKTMYQNTQKMLNGSETVTVYRGVKNSDAEQLEKGERITIKSYPLSSWSVSYNTAKEFSGDGGVVFRAEFPVSRVLSTPMSGFGCLGEEEFVIIGGDDVVEVVYSGKKILK